MKEFKDLDENEKLDAVMKWYYETGEHRYPDAASNFYKEKIMLYIDEMYSLLAFLVKEGYAERPQDAFKLTFAGRVFIKNSGYVKQAKLQKRKERNDKIQTLVLTIGSILAGIGTIALFAVEIYKIVRGVK